MCEIHDAKFRQTEHGALYGTHLYLILARAKKGLSLVELLHREAECVHAPSLDHADGFLDISHVALEALNGILQLLPYVLHGMPVAAGGVSATLLGSKCSVLLGQLLR